MGHIPRKRFGQNFLHDTHVINHIVQAIAPKSNDNLVEIGPGLGALTKPLLAQLDKLNVIELDRDLIPKLEKLPDAEKLNIYESDALKFDFNSLTQANKKIRVVGNLPYNISTPILFHLLTFAEHIDDMHFMLQKEVVDRLAAAPDTPAYGRLSVIMQYYCKVDYLFDVSKHAFHPPPKVESAIVRLQPYDIPPYDVGDEVLFQKIVKQAFAQRRKTLKNNLKTIMSADHIKECDIKPEVRAETLGVEDFSKLSKLLS